MDAVLNEELVEAKAVINILSNSKAYQYYIKSLNSLKEVCMIYADSQIKIVEDFMINKCINEGWLAVNHTMYYKSEYQIGKNNYISFNEISYIKNYFESDGFEFKYELEYNEVKGFFGRVKSRTPIKIKIILSWDFSKYKKEEDIINE